MYYCHDCKHWHSVWAIKTGGDDVKFGLCAMCLEELPGRTFEDCEDLANFISMNFGLLDYSCGANRMCEGYEEREDGK